MRVNDDVCMCVNNLRTKSMTTQMQWYAVHSTALTIGVKWNGSEPQPRRTCVVLLTEGQWEPEYPSLPWWATQASDGSFPLKQVFFAHRLCRYALNVQCVWQKRFYLEQASLFIINKLAKTVMIRMRKVSVLTFPVLQAADKDLRVETSCYWVFNNSCALLIKWNFTINPVKLTLPIACVTSNGCTVRCRDVSA